MKKILITGVTGFAGSYLARQIVPQKDCELFGTYLSVDSLSQISDIKNSIKPIHLDLMDFNGVKKVIEETKPDQLYHLAALTSPTQSFKEPAAVMVNNITAQINILENIKNANLSTRILVISSAEVYGQVDSSDIPIDEDTPFRPVNPYAVSKITQDFMGLQYHLGYGMDVVRVRPFNHIGPGQTYQFVTSAFAKKIAEIEKGKREPVLEVGNLEAKRDFTDVRDMVKAYVLLMEKGKSGDAYNVGLGKSYKISKILEILLSMSDKKIIVKKSPELLRPSDNPNLLCDNSKIAKLTGWKPEIALKQTLKEILDYWRNIV